MTKCAFIPNFLKFYNILWLAALPFLRRNRRLSATFEKRLSPQMARADIWIQAASAGEAFLALSILSSIRSSQGSPPAAAAPVRVLVTTTTDQGMEVLRRGLENLELPPPVSVRVNLFPFDIRTAVKKSVDQVRPKVMVLLETELWPAFLHEMTQQKIPVLILNGRMSQRSGGRYKKTRGLWQNLAPDRILAISQEDCDRYRAVFPNTPAAVMNNIKFDILDSREEKSPDQRALPAEAPSLPQLFPGPLPLAALASFRRQEEKEIITLLLKLRSRVPEQITALFPRHMHRIPALKKTLNRHRIPFRLRSELTGPVTGPEVILWDRFGELRQAYALAATVFVGGSLKPLGGQNFIEPAVLGIPTVTGPFRSDFAWAGEEIFSLGFISSVPDAPAAAKAMAENLRKNWDIKRNKELADGYMASNQGGSRTACRAILKAMDGRPPL